MNAKELRIGSWMLSKKFNVPVRLDLSDFYEAHVYAGNSDDLSWFNKHLEPLPVWVYLSDFGFQKDLKFGTQIWRRVNNEGLHLDWLEFHISNITCFGKVGRTQKNTFYSYGGKNVRIFNIHELQNIYLPLTGVDLEYKK